MKRGRAEPSFDAVARPYRWMEYATFGPALQRCRTHFLLRLLQRKLARRRALVLGDGDGRFTAALLAANPAIEIDAVDTSGAMLRLLRRRCVSAGKRLRTHRTNALSYLPEANCDLIATHFFLDCLTQAEVETLVARLTPFLSPDGLWVVSDFRIPQGPMRWPARVLVASLYSAFRSLTGLRTNQLPDHAAAFALAGLRCVARYDSLRGLLRTELWQAQPQPATDNQQPATDNLLLSR